MTARRLLMFLTTLIAISTASLAGKEDEKKAEFAGTNRAAQAALDRWLTALDELKSYSDEGTFEWKTGFGFGANEQKTSFTYVKPDRFRITSNTDDVFGDGKDLTVYRKNNRRYVTEKLNADMVSQLGKHGVSATAQFALSELILSKDRRGYAAERLKNVSVSGEEQIEGDKCILLEGQLVNKGAADSDEGRTVKMYIRDKDWMLRRMEIDMSDRSSDDSNDDSQPFRRFARDVKAVYDFKNIHVNHDVDASKLTFKAPSGAKKVDQFFSTLVQSGDTAQQFALSGKEAPDVDLDTSDGRKFSLSEKKGSVVALSVLAPRRGGRMGRRFRQVNPSFDKFDQLQRDFAGKSVAVVSINAGNSAEDLLDELREKNLTLTVALDADRTVAPDYFDEPDGSGLVLIGKDGIVQGRYPITLTDENYKALHSDVEKLLKGETLAGGKPMSPDQIREAQEQQSTVFAADSADPINEERLPETWTVHSPSGGQFFGFGRGQSGGGGGMKSGLWLQSRDVMQEVDASGKVASEIPIPRPVSGDNTQEEFVVGRMSGRRVLVHMSTIPGEEAGGGGGGFGFRPPKSAVITAGDEEGHELWSMEVEAKNRQVPQNLIMADFDGRGGDEVAFVHDGALWIVDERGEVIVRRQLPGRVSWIRADDLDRDKRAEIYVRTQNQLQRFDFKGSK